MPNQFPSDATVEVDTNFGPIRAFSGDYITNQLRRFGAHTRPELAMLLSVIRAGDGVFDLGAHMARSRCRSRKRSGAPAGS